MKKLNYIMLFFMTFVTPAALQADDDVLQYGNHISLKDYSGKYYGSKGLGGGMTSWQLVNADPANQKDAAVATGNKVFLKADNGKYLSAQNDADHHVALADVPKEWETWVVNAEPGSTNQLTRERKIWFTSVHGGRLHSEVGAAAGNVNASSGIATHRSCAWYDIGCNVTELVQNNPVTNFVKDTANKIGDFVKANVIDPTNEKVVGPIRDQAHKVQNYATTASKTIEALPDMIADKVMDITGGARKVCTNTPDPICPANSNTACTSVPVPSLADGLNTGAKALADTMKAIQDAIANVDKQKQAVIDQQLDKKQIQQLIELNTILVGPNGAFDELKAALNSVIAPDALGGLKTAFDTAAQEAKAGQAAITSNIQSIRDAINNPKIRGVSYGESLPARFKHIADVFSW